MTEEYKKYKGSPLHLSNTLCWDMRGKDFWSYQDNSIYQRIGSFVYVCVSDGLCVCVGSFIERD